MTVKLPIYLDNHATTAVDPRVWEAMVPFFREAFGNPASTSHKFGWEATKAVQRARQQVAELIGAQPNEIVFTSGATESNNLALKGTAHRHGRPVHIVTTTIEHSAVLDPCAQLERAGAEVTRLDVDKKGRIRLEDLESALRPETVLVSVMAANNEIGTIQDMEAIGRITRSRGVLLHSDATQAVGKVPVDCKRWQVDLLSLSAHKMYGPKGVGALYVRDGSASPECQLDGGGHERGMRSGTLNVPGIVGLGEAAHWSRVGMATESVRIGQLRDELKSRILGGLREVRVNGSETHRLPQNLHLTFQGVEGEALMMSLHDVAVSSGSACTSAKRSSSHVLRAIGLSDEEAHSSLRFGLGRYTTAEEVEYAAGRVIEAVQQLRVLA